jgi:diacylglycerol O-acyltransferase / wax synthase
MTDVERTARFDRRMSAGEALMWNVEKDPWLNPSGSIVCILDGPVDSSVVDRWLEALVADVPRLRERVVPGFGRFTVPSWAPDPEFSFGYHVRHVGAPAPGGERQLLDAVTVMTQEPFDRTRPLWQVVVLHGLQSDRAALYMKVHHSIADGYGTARLQERFMTREPGLPTPAAVDLDAIVAETCRQAAQERAEEQGGVVGGPLRGALGLMGRTASLSGRILTGTAGMVVDPRRAGDLAGRATGLVRLARSQLRSGAPEGEPATGDGGPASGAEGTGDRGRPAGSSLWTGRSRRRHLELVTVPLDEVKRIGETLGGSVNDVFMAALAQAAARYHEAEGAAVDVFNATFVISTRSDSAEGGNSFSPVRVGLPARPMPARDRLAAVQERVAETRSSFSGGGLMGGLANVANLLPTSLTTRVARSAAARVDFATSNVRGARRPLFIAGQRIASMFAVGPVAGSAMNVTVLSYDGNMAITMHSDPAAIAHPARLRDALEATFADLAATPAA